MVLRSHVSRALIDQLCGLEVVVMGPPGDSAPDHAGDGEPSAIADEDQNPDARQQRVGRQVRSLEAVAIAGGIVSGGRTFGSALRAPRRRLYVHTDP